MERSVPGTYFIMISLLYLSCCSHSRVGKTGSWGDQAYFEYSIDGRTFEKFGSTFTIRFGKWIGDRLGFFCWNEQREAGYIDIDFFCQRCGSNYINK